MVAPAVPPEVAAAVREASAAVLPMDVGRLAEAAVAERRRAGDAAAKLIRIRAAATKSGTTAIAAR
jgi:hypothetical protein